MNPPDSRVSRPGRAGWIFRARILTYSLLLVWCCEYFLLQPALIKPEDLPAPETSIQPLVSRLQGHVRFLASPDLLGRAPGTPGNAQAEHYLTKYFVDLGLDTPAPDGKRTQLLTDFLGNNVFSALPPVVPGRKWIILGAHFDHMGTLDGDDHLGADDNASSVAILLETISALKTKGPLAHYNLLFVGFNAEEPPWFLTQWMGSNQFFTRIREIGIEPDEVQLAIIMDLMGGLFWKPIQDSFFVFGAEQLPEIESIVAGLEVPQLQPRLLGVSMIENISGVEGPPAFSDYQVFRTHGVPWLFLSSGRTPRYHRPSDTAGTLHYPRMARTVPWLEQLIRRIDALETRWTFDPKRVNYEQDLRTLAPMVRSAATWSTRIPQTGWISLFKLKKDLALFEELQAGVETGEVLTTKDADAMASASIRMQCLLGKMGPCFMLPGN